MNEKMDPADKAKLVAALRSGEYQQGKFQLRSESGDEFYFPESVDPSKPAYCCLGVANEVLGLGCSADDAGLYRELPGGRSEPVGVPRWAQHILINMNDKQGRSFSYIADWIEESL